MADKLENLKAKIIQSIENLVTLEIVTAVGSVKPSEGGKGKSAELDHSKNPKVIQTKIDLLQGDIETIYDEAFVTGDYQNLKNFHALREKEGYDIVMRNIEALEKLLKLIASQSEG